MTEITTIENEPLHDRRATDKGLGGRVAWIERQLEAGDRRMTSMEGDIKGIREDTNASKEATQEVLEIVTMGKGFFKVLGHIGSVLKWLLGLGAAIAAIVAVNQKH